MDGPEENAPSGVRNLRACLRCGLVKTIEQFRQHGCDNCEALQLEGNEQAIRTCTTEDFQGLISMMQPSKSWVAKWQRISYLVSGCYAVTVNGDLPPREIQNLEENGDPVYLRKRVTGTYDVDTSMNVDY